MTTWESCKSIMPAPSALYWLSDGENYAIGKWSVENMWWVFLFHGAVFKPTWMLRIQIPEPPK